MSFFFLLLLSLFMYIRTVDSGEMFHCWSGMNVSLPKQETAVQEAKRLITRVVNLHDRADTIPWGWGYRVLVVGVLVGGGLVPPSATP